MTGAAPTRDCPERSPLSPRPRPRPGPCQAGSLALLAGCLLACDGGQPTSPEPHQTVAPSPTTACRAHNRPPSVTLVPAGETRCHPDKQKACQLRVRAEASDPDGDRLAYAWSGCAQGSGPEAVCTIPAPGPRAATVEVTDGCGGSASASLGFEGTNQAPVFQGFYSDPAPQPWGFALADDPEDGFCGGVSLRDCQVQGECRLLSCGKRCLSNSIEFAIETLPATGTCTLSMTVEDEWGLSAHGSTTFEW